MTVRLAGVIDVLDEAYPPAACRSRGIRSAWCAATPTMC